MGQICKEICFIAEPVAERSKERVCDRSRSGIKGSNHIGGMDVFFLCRVVSGRSLYNGPIPLPEESYRLWSV